MTTPTDPRAAAEELLALHEKATPGPWTREWYEDGESNEGPHGVFPGARGPMIESNNVIAQPTNDDPQGVEIASCYRGPDAAFVALAHALTPILARAVIEQADTIEAAEREKLKRYARIDRLRAEIVSLRADLASLRAAPPGPLADHVAGCAEDLWRCAAGWDPDARLLGNLTAREIAEVARRAMRTAAPLTEAEARAWATIRPLVERIAAGEWTGTVLGAVQDAWKARGAIPPEVRAGETGGQKDGVK